MTVCITVCTNVPQITYGLYAQISYVHVVSARERQGAPESARQRQGTPRSGKELQEAARSARERSGALGAQGSARERQAMPGSANDFEKHV